MPAADPQVRLEAVGALGGIHAPEVADALLDLLSDPSPAIRGAALRSLAAFDPENFVAVLSGLDPDPHWSVRAALATVLGTLPLETGLPRLEAMLTDTDQRVIPSVLASLVKLKAPKAAADPARAAEGRRSGGARGGRDRLGELKPANGAPALAEAYRFGERDSTYAARAAALAALAQYGAAEATPVLRERLRGQGLGGPRPRRDAARRSSIRQPRPTPTRRSVRRRRPSRAEVYTAARLVNPPVSTQVYLDTDRGTIQIELAVLDAPLTVENFIALARKGFFNGLSVHRVVPDFVVQDGDPRGDGEGDARLHDPRRAERAAVPARHRRHGARSLARHRRQPVLHHALTAAAPRRAVHRLRPRHRRHGRRRQDSAVGRDPAGARLGRAADDGPGQVGVARRLRVER